MIVITILMMMMMMMMKMMVVASSCWRPHGDDQAQRGTTSMFKVNYLCRDSGWGQVWSVANYLTRPIQQNLR